MNSTTVYLKPNVVIEPLYDRWYAWAHLISPGSAAMNIVYRHLEIMESYIADPKIHADAAKNPMFRGGPFMDYTRERVKDVEQLLQKTRRDQSLAIGFAKALKELERLLATEAKGFGLQPLYQKVPDLLKGYVELYYDRNNYPGFRFYEALLYSSPFYREKSQSIALWLTNNDHRPFSLSTPHLNEPDTIHLDIPFASDKVDELARMTKTPMPYEYIKDLLGIPPASEPLFETFFTTSNPPAYNRYNGDNIRMRYFGHACILIETKNVSILMDPIVSYYGYHSDVEHYSFADLPDKIDYVILTHNHQDHILFETLLPLRHKIKHMIVPGSNSGKLEDSDLKLMFNRIGFDNVITLEEMRTTQFSDAAVTALPFIGEHGDLNILTKSCFLVQFDEFKLLFLADSRVVEPALYKHVHEITGDVDVIFLGMECDGAPLTWLYGPLMAKKISRDQDGSRRLAGSDCTMGMALIDIFRPKEAYVYAMGQEPWIEFISTIKYTEESNPIVQSDKLIKLCLQRGIVAERLYGEKEILYNRQLMNHVSCR